MRLICPTGEFLWGWHDYATGGVPDYINPEDVDPEEIEEYVRWYDISRYVGTTYRTNYIGRIEPEPIMFNRTSSLELMLKAVDRYPPTLYPISLPYASFSAYREEGENSNTIHLYIQTENSLSEIGSVPPEISEILCPFIDNGGTVTFKYEINQSNNNDFSWELYLGTCTLLGDFNIDSFINELSNNGVPDIHKDYLFIYHKDVYSRITSKREDLIERFNPALND